jgi:hypothetical protein
MVRRLRRAAAVVLSGSEGSTMSLQLTISAPGIDAPRAGVGPDSDECYTPRWLIEVAEAILGGPIETDPAWSPRSLVRPLITGYTFADDGATRPWFGRTWINPPYSNPLPFMNRAADFPPFDSDGQLAPALALVRLDPTTQWWATAMRIRPRVCLLADRVAFQGDYAGGNPAPISCALIAWRCVAFPASVGSWMRPFTA